MPYLWCKSSNEVLNWALLQSLADFPPALPVLYSSCLDSWHGCGGGVGRKLAPWRGNKKRGSGAHGRKLRHPTSYSIRLPPPIFRALYASRYRCLWQNYSTRNSLSHWIHHGLLVCKFPSPHCDHPTTTILFRLLIQHFEKTPNQQILCTDSCHLLMRKEFWWFSR